MASWHPLFAGSAAYAELGDDLGRHGLEYLNTDLPTGPRSPTAGRVPHDLARGQRRRVRAPRAPATAPPGALSSSSSWRLPTTASACSRPSSGRSAGLGLARKAYGSFGRRGLLAFAGELADQRAATGWPRRSSRERAHGLLAPWVLHTGLGPEQAVVGLHDAGHRVRDPARRHARAARRRRAPGRRARRDRARERRRAAHGRRRRSHPALRRPRQRRAAGDGERSSPRAP